MDINNRGTGWEGIVVMDKILMKDDSSKPWAYFIPMVFFDTPWVHWKTRGFLMFSGGIERDKWHEMGEVWYICAIAAKIQATVKQGGVNFNYLPQRGVSEKFLKSGWKFGAGASLIFFKVYHFYI